jgi:trehalose 6-phosphate synthase
VAYKGRETLVRPYPISVDYEKIDREKSKAEVAAAAARLKSELGIDYEFIGVSVDRIDYTKGIPEKFRAIDRFLEKHPHYQGRFVFVQVGTLSRIHIAQYKAVNDEINRLAEEINWKYSSGHWAPIVLVRRHLLPDELLALYQMADLCIVSSLHDGMNLVAKEYVSAAGEERGMLVLSKFTGAARELSDALLVNPYEPDNFAAALKEALELPRVIRKRKMRSMKNQLAEYNIYRWAAEIIRALLRISA